MIYKAPQLPQEHQLLVATPRPGLFALGSLESRAVARALADAKFRNGRISPEIHDAIVNPLKWLQHYTRTRDSHWRESGASTPYRPFPEKPYFPVLVDIFRSEPVIFVEKSRDMMLSWLCVGWFTHSAMTNDQREVLFQSQKEDKAAELIDYAKTHNSLPARPQDEQFATNAPTLSE